MSKEISRRDFLKGAAAGALTAALLQQRKKKATPGMMRSTLPNPIPSPISPRPSRLTSLLSVQATAVWSPQRL